MYLQPRSQELPLSGVRKERKRVKDSGKKKKDPGNKKRKTKKDPGNEVGLSLSNAYVLS